MEPTALLPISFGSVEASPMLRVSISGVGASYLCGTWEVGGMGWKKDLRHLGDLNFIAFGVRFYWQDPFNVRVRCEMKSHKKSKPLLRRAPDVSGTNMRRSLMVA